MCVAIERVHAQRPYRILIRRATPHRTLLILVVVRTVRPVRVVKVRLKFPNVSKSIKQLINDPINYTIIDYTIILFLTAWTDA